MEVAVDVLDGDGKGRVLAVVAVGEGQRDGLDHAAGVGGGGQYRHDVPGPPPGPEGGGPVPGPAERSDGNNHVGAATAQVAGAEKVNPVLEIREEKGKNSMVNEYYKNIT